MIVLLSKALSTHVKSFFFGRKVLKRCSEETSCGTERPEIEKKRDRNSLKSPPFQAWRWDRIRHRSGQQHTYISPQPLRSEQKHQVYTSIWPYILLALTAFQQLLVPIQMSRLSPFANWGEAIWAAEYKWLGMIDRPSHSPPSSDR